MGCRCWSLLVPQSLYRGFVVSSRQKCQIFENGIRLFEGFVSFKEAGTDNRKDVSALREKVKNALQCQDSIYDPEELKLSESDEICSAFRLADLDCGIPAVIIAGEPGAHVPILGHGLATDPDPTPAL